MYEAKENPIIIIILSSITATLEIVLGILIGVIFSHPKIGILTNQIVIGFVAKLQLYLFLPCFVCRNFGIGLNFEMLKDVWIIPIFGFVIIFLQIIVSNMFFPKMLYNSNDDDGEKKGKQRMVLKLSVSFTNWGMYPMIYMTSLIRTSGIFLDPNAEEISLAFISLYGIATVSLFYSFGLYQIRSIRGDLSEKDEGINNKKEENIKKKKKLWKIYVCNIFETIGKILSPPMIAVIIGSIIGAYKPFQNFIFNNPPQIMSSITNVVEKFGNITLGVSMLLAGSNLGNTIFAKTARYDTIWGKLKGFFLFEHVSFYNTLKSSIIKLILFPVLIILILLIFNQYLGHTLLKNDDTRPLVYLMIIIQASVPLMLSLNAMVSLYNSGKEVLAEIMLVQYFLAPFTTVGFTIFGLFLVCSYEKCNL